MIRHGLVDWLDIGWLVSKTQVGWLVRRRLVGRLLRNMWVGLLGIRWGRIADGARRRPLPKALGVSYA